MEALLSPLQEGASTKGRVVACPFAESIVPPAPEGGSLQGNHVLDSRIQDEVVGGAEEPERGHVAAASTASK